MPAFQIELLPLLYPVFQRLLTSLQYSKVRGSVTTAERSLRSFEDWAYGKDEVKSTEFCLIETYNVFGRANQMAVGME